MPVSGVIEPDSLYISINGRIERGTYHWGLVLVDSGKRAFLHHSNNSIGPWTYEARQVDPDRSMTLVALIFVAKVDKPSEVTEVMKKVPVGQPSSRTGIEFSCETWVDDVLVLLNEEKALDRAIDMETLKKRAMDIGREHTPLVEQGEAAKVVNVF
ncbi:hypothetical protein E4U55_003337 [Claviceps digitariae]|nr:hypothetical protein E4U55_003337 [Claviceps digitariae]